VFWESIIEGFKVLAHWQVWVAVLIYLLINLSFLFIIAMVVGQKESGGRMATGCLFQMFGGTILHGALMGFLVAFLLPLMLGGNSTLPLSYFPSLLWPLFKVGLIAIIAVTLLCFIPLIGHFISESPGVQAFLEGVIIFRLISSSTVEEVLSITHISGNIYPGFLTSLGFLIISGISVYAIVFIISLLSTYFEGTTTGELLPIVIGPAFGVIGGIIPLFMYSSYVHLSIKHLM
jgi:hypothetical protein